MIEAVAGTIVVIGFAYLAAALIGSLRKRATPDLGDEPELFVFVVPALNEERVIEQTVSSLLAACGDRGHILVVDDGSDDSTGEILERMAADNGERLWVLTRRTPDARKGKGAALNAAFTNLERIADQRGVDLAAVVVGIVDADGRVTPDVIEKITPYFRTPQVGAVQLLVRIRNRAKLLARFQDYEFLVFSSITQTAREKIGSVGLGGNGQFTRLAALKDLGAEPWSDCLTEDLDLGVRLAIAGWDNRFCSETFVDQQGLTSVSRIIRQRTRWMHGHFQCWRLIPKIIASQLPTVTVLDLCYYLLSPAFILAASVLFTVPWLILLFTVATNAALWTSPFWLIYLASLYLLSFGPSIALSLVYRHRARDISVVYAFMLGHLLAAYNYLWYIAEWKAVFRIIFRRRGWTKTARVLEAEPRETTGDSTSGRHGLGRAQGIPVSLLTNR